MLRYPLVIAAQDLDADPLCLECRDCGPGTLLGRIGENCKASEDQLLFVGYCYLCAVRLKLAPGDAEGAKPLRAQLLEDTSGAGSRGGLKRLRRGVGWFFVLAGSLDHILRCALGD